MTTHLRRLGALTVAAVLAIGLSGCSKDDTKSLPPTTNTTSATSAPSTGPSGSATSTPEPSTIVDPKTGDEDFCKAKEQAPFTGAAATTFGADNVMAAYCEFGNFGLNEGWTNLMETKSSYAPVEFSFVKPYMTQGMQKDWDATVAKAIKGDQDEVFNVKTLTGFAMENDKIEFDPSTPRVIDKTVSGATTSVGKDRDGNPALVLRTTFQAELLLKQKSTGKHLGVTMVRPTTFVLVPSGDPQHPWLMDGWRGELNQGKVRTMD